MKKNAYSGGRYNLLAALILLWSFSALLSSCKALHAGDTLQAEAIVLLGVPPEADGCGNMLYIDSVFYRVEDLPAGFHQDELRVNVSYIAADTFYCGRGRSPIPAVRVISIQRADQEKRSDTNSKP